MSNETTDLVMPSVPERGRRVVLEHTQGPFRGLRQIVGHTDEFKGQQPDIFAEGITIEPGRRIGVIGLVASFTRYVLYRETDSTKPVRLR